MKLAEIREHSYYWIFKRQLDLIKAFEEIVRQRNAFVNVLVVLCHPKEEALDDEGCRERGMKIERRK